MGKARTRTRQRPASEEGLAAAVGTVLGAARGRTPAAIDELADRERGSPGTIDRPTRGASRPAPSRPVRSRGRSR